MGGDRARMSVSHACRSKGILSAFRSNAARVTCSLASPAQLSPASLLSSGYKIGVAGRNPHPNVRRNGDHRGRPSVSAATAAFGVAASTVPVIRIRAPAANSIRSRRRPARPDQASALFPRPPSPARSSFDGRHPSARGETTGAIGAAMSARRHIAAPLPQPGAAPVSSPRRS